MKITLSQRELNVLTSEFPALYKFSSPSNPHFPTEHFLPIAKSIANMVVPTIKLSSGYEMPQVGFGLWKVDNATCADTVYNAIKQGYRLFDGACGKFLMPIFRLIWQIGDLQICQLSESSGTLG